MGTSKKTLVGDHEVRIGGLFRCCVATLENWADEPVPDSGLLDCDYESVSRTPRMRLAEDGAWEWNKPDDT